MVDAHYRAAAHFFIASLNAAKMKIMHKNRKTSIALRRGETSYRRAREPIHNLT